MLAVRRRPPASCQARPATASSPLPPGSASFIVEVGGRVWSAGAHSLRPIAGRLSTIAVSPGALYELQAKAHLLRAVASRSGRVAFTHRVRGRVIAASWSPLPIRIAFLEQTPSGYVMHDMWGTGSHDRRGPGLAAPVAPSWRWDSLAVAFVRANGRVAILSPTSGAVKTLPRVCSIRRAQAIAYSPSNGLLAIAGGRRVGDRGYDGVAAASLHPACRGNAVAGVARRSAARHRRRQPPPESQRRLVRCAIVCRYGARKHHDPRAGSTGTWDRNRDRSAAGHERLGRDG